MRDVVIVVLKTIYVVDAVLLVLVILLQSGRGGGLAGAFGTPGSADSAFGTKAGTFLGKVTAVMAAVFILIAILLGILYRPAGAARAESQEKPPPTATGPFAEPKKPPEETPAPEETKAKQPGAESTRPKGSESRGSPAAPGTDASKTKAADPSSSAHPSPRQPLA